MTNQKRKNEIILEKFNEETDEEVKKQLWQDYMWQKRLDEASESAMQSHPEHVRLQILKNMFASVQADKDNVPIDDYEDEEDVLLS